MTFQPIAERELRVAARKASTYWRRTGVGFIVALVAFGFIIAGHGGVAPSQVGTNLFGTLIGMAFLYVVFAGAHYTADCISEEKREGTLGLLFLTPLRGYDVILGKLTSNSIHAVFGLVTFLPVLAIPILLGGVDWGEFVRAAVILGSFLLLSLSLGICMSTLTRESRRALGMTGLLLIGLIGIPALVGVLLMLPGVDANPAMQFAMKIAPGSGSVMTAIPESGYALQKDAFWLWLCTTHGLAIALLVLASMVVPRTWQQKSVPSHERKSLTRRIVDAATLARRFVERARPLDRNPVFWLTLRRNRQRYYALAFVLLYPALGIFFMVWPAGWEAFPIVTVFAPFLFHLVLKVWVASEAVRCFADARRSGALELILSTPLRAGQMISGQLQALRSIFLWPLVLLLGTEVVFVLIAHLIGADSFAMAGPRGGPFMNAGGNFPWLYWFLMTAASIAVRVADLVALAFVGMWLGLSAKNANRAASNTFALVVILPWVLGRFALTLGTAALLLTGAIGFFWIQFVLPAVLWLLKDVAFILWARTRLRKRLRNVAGATYTDPDPWVDWWRRIRGRRSTGLPPVIGAR